MGRRKTVIYTNCYGQEIFFDNRVFFCEEIKLSGGAAKYSSLALSYSDGQVTSGYGAEPLPIHFRFSFFDRQNNEYLRNRLMDVFTPTEPGVLKIYTENEVYSIDVHLTARPEIKRTGRRVYTGEADFTADFPYFRKGVRMSEITTDDTHTEIISRSPVKLFPVITFFGGARIRNDTTGSGFSVSKYFGSAEYITVDTNTFKVRDNNGNDVNYLIAGNEDIGDVFLMPGENDIYCTRSGTVIRWWELRGGII